MLQVIYLLILRRYHSNIYLLVGISLSQYLILQILYVCNRLKKSETEIFFEVDSNHFLFSLQNGSEEFPASTWDSHDNRNYIPLSTFDDNNELIVYFTSSILGMYTVKFYTISADEGATPVINGT